MLCWAPWNESPLWWHSSAQIAYFFTSELLGAEMDDIYYKEIMNNLHELWDNES